jgi:hypothetical protein
MHNTQLPLAICKSSGTDKICGNKRPTSSAMLLHRDWNSIVFIAIARGSLFSGEFIQKLYAEAQQGIVYIVKQK